MIKVLAIEDEPLALRQMESYIERIPFLELVNSCHCAAEAVPFLLEVDAIFTDIDMPGLNGMDFVKSLENPPLVVFTTAYSEYAVEGFRIDAAGYLLKPFSFDEFLKTAEKLRQRITEIKALQETTKAQEYILFKADYRTLKIKLSDIVYIESMSEYIKIHMGEGTAPVVVLYSLKRLSDELPEGSFCRVHRSYIVSLKHIAKAGGGRITLTDGTEIPVGDTYRQLFNEKWPGL